MTGGDANALAAFRRRRHRNHEPAALDPSRTLAVDCAGEPAFVIAERQRGERAFPLHGRTVLLPASRLVRHLLVCGATGSGKTETLLRLAHTIAQSTDAPVFYLDGKGDRENARRFLGLMQLAGRSCRVFPTEPFAGFRGQPEHIQGRLMEIIDYSTEGPAAWYRDIAKTTLTLVCQHPDGPPRSSRELLARIDLRALRAAYSNRGAVQALQAQQVAQVRLRYEAFFGQTRGALDGTWAWEDTPAAYLLMDTLALREEAAGLARFLFEDFAHYFTTRKPRAQLCVLIVDEFSALAASANMASRIEQARGFRAAIVLAPQVVSGMGDPEQVARILGSVETVVCHRVNTPEDVIALAGTRKAIEYSTHYGDQGLGREGSTRLQHQFKIDPNTVRSLAPGVAYLISQGRAMRAAIHQAPHASAELPQPATAATASLAEAQPVSREVFEVVPVTSPPSEKAQTQIAPATHNGADSPSLTQSEVPY